jgi:glycosyltransferase involved in cell wall biosynthesis
VNYYGQINRNLFQDGTRVSGGLVSVIVPTKNSAGTIEMCLKSIKEQTYLDLEIIVVDNYSEDRTVEIAKRDGAKVFYKGPERCAQVNFGIEMANGKYIYRVDSDFILEPSIVSECIEVCEKKGYDAIAVHNASDPTISFWSKVRNLERNCYRYDELNIGARFIRKDIFNNIGFFDEKLVAGEDYDLHNRLIKGGFKVGKIKSQEWHIGEPKSLCEIVKKHYYYGKTIGEFIKINPKTYKKQLTPLRSSYFRHWINFIKHPILTSGFIVYQSFRYSAALLGLLSIKLK